MRKFAFICAMAGIALGEPMIVMPVMAQTSAADVTAPAQTSTLASVVSDIDPYALKLAREDIALSIAPEFRDVFLKTPGTAEFLEAEARAYTRQFSVTELEQIHVFRASPVGQRLASIPTWIDKDPDVIAVKKREMDAFQAQMRKNLGSLPSTDGVPNAGGIPQNNSAPEPTGQNTAAQSSGQH